MKTQMATRIELDTKICVPILKRIKGGPFLLHYDCRCGAEAEVIREAIQRDLDETLTEARRAGVEQGIDMMQSTIQRQTQFNQNLENDNLRWRQKIQGLEKRLARRSKGRKK